MKAVAVATAEEALQVLEHSAIDILLTDLKLQQSSGVDLLKQVHDLHPEVAAVVLTQYGTIESAMEVTRMGAVDYVTKPFRIEELRSRFERVARAVELQQEFCTGAGFAAAGFVTAASGFAAAAGLTAGFAAA